IRDRRTFRALRQAKRVRRGPVTVSWLPEPPGSPPTIPRAAYAIGRHIGGAVQRNRLRRRLRAVMAGAELAPGAYLVGASVEAADLSAKELQSIVKQALDELMALR